MHDVTSNKYVKPAQLCRHRVRTDTLKPNHLGHAVAQRTHTNRASTSGKRDMHHIGCRRSKMTCRHGLVTHYATQAHASSDDVFGLQPVVVGSEARVSDEQTRGTWCCPFPKRFTATGAKASNPARDMCASSGYQTSAGNCSFAQPPLANPELRT